MKRNKKAFIILIVIVVSVFMLGVVATTYAWFLSRYGTDYYFELKSQSPLVIKYETDLDFASGTDSTATNVLIPATEKSVDAGGDPIPGISQAALDPLDVFYDDPSTGKVATAAQAVKYTASGAYYTGEEVKLGDFDPRLYAYTNDFLTSNELSSHLASLADPQETLTLNEETLCDLLSREEARKSNAVDYLIARNDLVMRGEISYLMIINYLGKTFLLYDGTYYILGATGETAFPLPEAIESDPELSIWNVPTADNSTVNERQISDGTHFYLQPNTTFSFTLYVFVAKTDERLDPAINGERITLFMSMSVEEVNEVTPVPSVEP